MHYAKETDRFVYKNKQHSKVRVGNDAPLKEYDNFSGSMGSCRDVGAIQSSSKEKGQWQDFLYSKERVRMP